MTRRRKKIFYSLGAVALVVASFALYAKMTRPEDPLDQLSGLACVSDQISISTAWPKGPWVYHRLIELSADQAKILAKINDSNRSGAWRYTAFRKSAYSDIGSLRNQTTEIRIGPMSESGTIKLREERPATPAEAIPGRLGVFLSGLLLRLGYDPMKGA